MTGESRRQIEHMLPLAFAFLLRWLSLWQAVACALGAVAYGLWGSPRLNRAGVRPEEATRGYSRGKLYYALSVLALILIFRQRMHVVAGAWAALALGDGVSNMAGRAWGKRKLPWSAQKTWVGLAAFVLAAWPGIAALVFWTAAGTGVQLPGTGLCLAFCVAAALAAAVIESLPLPLDDNLSVPAAAAAVLALTL